MISTLKQVAMAEKLSVPQLQQAVKNGTIESWIGIPMIQERMKDQKEAQAAAAAQQPQQPKVAEQVLMEAAQQGLDGLPTNLPQQYAQGGILGYAEGGDTDEAYEQYLEDVEEEEFAKYAEAMLNKTPDVEKGIRSAPSMSYGQVQGQQLRAARQPGVGVNSLIGEAAAKHGIPPDLASRIAIAEGGGRMDAKDPRSSAKGGFGMIDSTWRAMGGTAENRFDPNVNAELGTKLIRQNAEAMKKALGRDPSYGEVYAAHHFGTGVSKMLKGASPDTPIERGLSMFESPKRVKLIMEQNPYLKGKTVGDVMNRIEGKMGEGIVSLAEGGIARFEEGGLPSLPASYDPLEYEMYENPTSGEIYPRKKDTSPTLKEKAQGIQRPIYQPSAIRQGTNPRALENQSMVAEKAFEKQVAKDKEAQQVQREAAATTQAAAESTEKTPSAYDRLMGILEENLAKREENKKQDQWMGLLSAGLGMMSGTSPYAAANVGQGAMFGVQQYGAARKASAAEEASTLKNMITAQRYHDLQKSYESKLGMTQAQKEADRRLEEQKMFGNMLTNLQSKRVSEAQARYGKDVNLMSPEVRKQYEDYIDAIKKDPRYIEAEIGYFGRLPEGVKVTPSSSK